MARNAVAKGKPGAKHSISEAVQGKYHYTYGPFAKPALTVDPGAVVSCETHDAFEGAIKLATDKPSEKLNFPFLNPQNGPIFVNGAAKGDCPACWPLIRLIVGVIRNEITENAGRHWGPDNHGWLAGFVSICGTCCHSG